ncbi:MAG: MASE1 domain-containing protein [Minicystis sp.]
MATDRASLRTQAWLDALVLGVAFFAMGTFANQFSFPPHPSSVLWLPSGLSLAFLLRSPPRCWPSLLVAVFLADFATTLDHGFPLPAWVSGLWGLANVLRTLLAAWLLRRFVGTVIHLSRCREIAGLILFGGLVAPMASATIGSLSYLLSSAHASFAGDWVNWWLSDGLGTILIAPLLLTWTPATLRSTRSRRVAELVVLLGVTALGAHFIFGQRAPSAFRASLAYVSFPFALLGALRMGPLGAAGTSAVVAVVALWHTMVGRGPFGALSASLAEKVLTLQMFLALLAVTALTLAAMVAEAHQAIEARNELITMAGHELRTPLTSLILRVQHLDARLHRVRGCEAAREDARAVSHQLKRLARLVERVLDVGLMASGRLEIHREAVNVVGLVEQVVATFAEEATRAGSALRVDAPASLAACWDRGRVEQALANLMANALKFGAGHPIDIHVSIDGRWVGIEVRDHGIGIAPEALKRIFDRFERAVSLRNYGGLGLGLYLTREIAEAHGGTIRARSRPGKGATFVLKLPVGERG